MIRIDCSELTSDEELALASAISDHLEGSGFALIKGDDIVVDQLTDMRIELETIVSVVKGFISKRKDSSLYGLDVRGDTLMIHSPDPIAARSSRTSRSRLPPNVFQCPACGFMAPSLEKLDYHLRTHDILRGLR
jgi:hypothetical protein